MSESIPEPKEPRRLWGNSPARSSARPERSVAEAGMEAVPRSSMVGTGVGVAGASSVERARSAAMSMRTPWIFRARDEIGSPRADST